MSFGKLMALMALFVVIGVPMVAFLWETVNLLLALHVDGTRLLIALPLLVVFIGFLVVLARTVRRWNAQQIGGKHG